MLNNRKLAKIFWIANGVSLKSAYWVLVSFFKCMWKMHVTCTLYIIGSNTVWKQYRLLSTQYKKDLSLYSFNLNKFSFWHTEIDLVSARCLHFRIYLVGFVDSTEKRLKIYLENAIWSNASQLEFSLRRVKTCQYFTISWRS